MSAARAMAPLLQGASGEALSGVPRPTSPGVTSTFTTATSTTSSSTTTSIVPPLDVPPAAHPLHPTTGRGARPLGTPGTTPAVAWPARGRRPVAPTTGGGTHTRPERSASSTDGTGQEQAPGRTTGASEVRGTTGKAPSPRPAAAAVGPRPTPSGLAPDRAAAPRLLAARGMRGSAQARKPL